MRPFGKAVESRTHIVGECEIYKEERDVLEEVRKIDKCTYHGEVWHTIKIYSSEKTIAVILDGWWPETAKQGGNKMEQKEKVTYGKT